MKGGKPTLSSLMYLAAIGQHSTSALSFAQGSSPAVLVVMMPLLSAHAWNFSLPQSESEWILVRWNPSALNLITISGAARTASFADLDIFNIRGFMLLFKIFSFQNRGALRHFSNVWLRSALQ